MKEVIVKVFKFNELEESVQRKVIEKHYDINVEYDWWEFVYDSIREDLNDCGLACDKIYFSLDRDEHIELVKLHFTDLEKFLSTKVDTKIKKSLISIADLSVAETHYGRHGVAKVEATFGFPDRTPRVNKAVDGLVDRCNDALADLTHSFIKMLRDEYEYLTSEEAIKETIECNEYDFRENGELFHG